MYYPLVVSGSRNPDHIDAMLAFEYLDIVRSYIRGLGKEPRLYVGDAKGFDEVCYRWSILRDVPRRSFIADWSSLGDGAGHHRNTDVLSAAIYEGRPLLVAHPGPHSRGTRNMVGQAIAKNVPVRVIGLFAGDLFCSECRGFQFNTPSGLTCNEGHGGAESATWDPIFMAEGASL